MTRRCLRVTRLKRQRDSRAERRCEAKHGDRTSQDTCTESLTARSGSRGKWKTGEGIQQGCVRWEVGRVLGLARPGIPSQAFGLCPRGAGEQREVAQTVAQKQHRTCMLGGSRQLPGGGRIWRGVLEGCVKGTVDARPDPLSWARAPLTCSEYGL